jgi:hypothetical protein
MARQRLRFAPAAKRAGLGREWIAQRPAAQLFALCAGRTVPNRGRHSPNAKARFRRARPHFEGLRRAKKRPVKSLFGQLHPQIFVLDKRPPVFATAFDMVFFAFNLILDVSDLSIVEKITYEKTNIFKIFSYK